MEAKQISKAVIKRLPRYYRYLGELLEDNVERISSNDLSKKMRVTASNHSFRESYLICPDNPLFLSHFWS